MTNEELVEMYHDGDESALHELIEQNKKLIFRIACKYSVCETASIDYEDLFQEGAMGLIAAAQKYNFDIENKAAFSTYAVYWIRQKISRFIKYRGTNNESSLNVPVGDDGEGEKIDFISDEEEGFMKIEDTIYWQELHQELEDAMNEVLKLRQKQILYLRYGYDGKPCSLQETGDIMGVTRERIRQLEVVSLRKLRKSQWGINKQNELISEFGHIGIRPTIQEEAKLIEEKNKRQEEATNAFMKRHEDYLKKVKELGGIDEYIRYMKIEAANAENKMRLI